MKITILIIDDKPIMAKSIKAAIDTTESRWPTLLGYSTIVITNINAFDKGLEYFRNHKQEIDILLIDYHLYRHTATEFLCKLDYSGTLIYKIVHSITARIPGEMSFDTAKYLIDDFTYSKDQESIRKTVARYEKNILNIKIWGHPKFRSKYLVNENRWSNGFDPDIKIPYYKILCAETDQKGDDETTIYYRDDDGKVTVCRRTKLPLKSTFLSEKLWFARVNRSRVINLLWVANIDLLRQKLRFITFDNNIFEIDLNPTARFTKEVRQHLKKINSLPDFFSR